MNSGSPGRLEGQGFQVERTALIGTLIVTEFMTLDGIGQAPGGPEEDPEGGFQYGGWQAPLVEAEAGGVIFDQAKTMDALLLGRRTYDIFAGYWPSAPAELGFTRLLNRIPKYVATRKTIAASFRPTRVSACRTRSAARPRSQRGWRRVRCFYGPPSSRSQVRARPASSA